MQRWYEQEGKDSDVILSSRIRLARNLKGKLFPERMTTSDAKEIVDKVLAQTTVLTKKENKKFYPCRLNALRDLDKASMVEGNIISPLLAQKESDTGLILSEDERISIMINEEDHLHIQTVYGGMNMSKALTEAMKLDDYFSECFGYAFDDRYGYLTSCPTNVGTGLRASYTLFLPALSMAGKIEKLAEEIGKYGAQIRSIYGEGAKSYGHVYQISNKASLGRSESEIIDNLDQIVTQAMNQERKRREYILTVNSEEIEDKVYRSYGVLKYAKKVSTADAMLMLSQLKFGKDCNVIEFKGECNLQQLMLEIMPANFQKVIGKTINHSERDRYRAEYLNQKLPELID